MTGPAPDFSLSVTNSDNDQTGPPTPSSDSTLVPSSDKSTRLPFGWMATSSAFFSREFWTGDYVNYPSDLTWPAMAAGELSFSHRLARSTLVTGYHNLRGDVGYSPTTARRQYRYALGVRSIGFILADTRQILVRLASSSSSSSASYAGQSQPLSIYFNNHPTTVQFARDLHAHMSHAASDSDANYLDADQVHRYLRDNGLCLSPSSSDDGAVRMFLPIPSRHNNHQPPTTLTRHVELDPQTLIRRLGDVAVCLGSGVGYPKARLNHVIAAAVVRVLVR